MSGTVRHGEGIGKKRLFPTANLVPDAHSIVPKRGVYATRAHLPDGTQYVGVTNVGVRPDGQRGKPCDGGDLPDGL